ncbi:MAG TPA: hypothetical protein DD490_20450 [Acidobacteria bacterium]|nr:hypothetical protein [Acidobacteriota bacterium]
MEMTDLEAIDKLFLDWTEAGRRQDAGALAQMVTEDGEFWAHEAPPLRGREALVVRMTEFYETYDIDQSFEREEIVISGDLAFVRGIEVNRVTVRDDADAPPLEIRQRAFSVLFRGADGAWRFARGMTHKPPEEQPG